MNLRYHAIEQTAQFLNVIVESCSAKSRRQCAFGAMRDRRPDALSRNGCAHQYSQKRVIEFSATHRIRRCMDRVPPSGGWVGSVDVSQEMFKARKLHRSIFKGAKPTELPAEHRRSTNSPSTSSPPRLSAEIPPVCSCAPTRWSNSGEATDSSRGQPAVSPQAGSASARVRSWHWFTGGVRSNRRKAASMTRCSGLFLDCRLIGDEGRAADVVTTPSCDPFGLSTWWGSPTRRCAGRNPRHAIESCCLFADTGPGSRRHVGNPLGTMPYTCAPARTLDQAVSRRIGPL
jgi:hypothetical protein